MEMSDVENQWPENQPYKVSFPSSHACVAMPAKRPPLTERREKKLMCAIASGTRGGEEAVVYCILVALWGLAVFENTCVASTCCPCCLLVWLSNDRKWRVTMECANADAQSFGMHCLQGWSLQKEAFSRWSSCLRVATARRRRRP